jgi:ubiquinone/menaquinone biosynthesis C-methylase UbiE
MKLVENVLFAVSRWLLSRRPRSHVAPDDGRTAVDYDRWRYDALERMLRHFNTDMLRGKRVLDFGCQHGLLMRHLVDCGAQEVIGVDVDEAQLRIALQAVTTRDATNVTVRLAPNPKTIPVPDSSVDIVCCFAVLEHVMHPVDVLHEWRRVLVTGGEVWIQWSTWKNYRAGHIYGMIPIPWIHLILPEATIIRIAARIYEESCYQPQFWDFDAATGERLRNPWLRGRDILSWNNRLTLRPFLRMCREAGFRPEVTVYGLGQQRKEVRPLGSLAHVPWVGEYFAAEHRVVLRLGVEQMPQMDRSGDVPAGLERRRSAEPRPGSKGTRSRRCSRGHDV